MTKNKEKENARTSQTKIRLILATLGGSLTAVVLGGLSMVFTSEALNLLYRLYRFEIDLPISFKFLGGKSDSFYMFLGLFLLLVLAVLGGVVGFINHQRKYS